jgi:chromosome transmission fidelity protein 1
VETVLQSYSNAVQSTSDVRDLSYSVAKYDADLAFQPKKTGALLFAVVGAKLSEGLNFTDELARAVILVGLPYPNLGSVDLKERMKYVTELGKATMKKSVEGKDPGQELYENICMKAVNQSIGRPSIATMDIN